MELCWWGGVHFPVDLRKVAAEWNADIIINIPLTFVMI